MQTESHHVPTVLAIGGHDPGGGAGIQADIESIVANGCHAASVVSCLTVQDSCNLNSLHPVDTEIVMAQVRAVLEDASVDALKLGLIGDPAIACALASLLREHRQLPVVLDPVLAAGGGTNLADAQLIQAMRDELLPLCRLITPNSIEARRLSGSDLSLDSCSRALLKFGAGAVLITGTHEQSDKVVNRLYDASGLIDESSWPRLPGEYHGSGCTLASAICARMALGRSLVEAVREAQAYSWKSLQAGYRTGRCQSLPDRLHRLERFTR